jgi:ABC-type sugar transport system substrate-binding protein
MKNRVLVMVSVLLLLLLAPVSFVAAKGAPEGGGEKTVAGIVFQEDQFMKLMALGYADAAKEAGFRILQANTGNGFFAAPLRSALCRDK